MTQHRFRIVFIGVMLFLASGYLLWISTVKDTSPPPRIVVSFSILKDLTENVLGKELVQTLGVESIVPHHADPHTYMPKPQDVRLLHSASVLILNGLGFEGWIDRLRPSFKGIVCVMAEHPHFKDKIGEPYDPHFWHSVPYAMVYVQEISSVLCNAFPEHKAIIEENTRQFLIALSSLHQWVQETLKPLKQRTVVTTHDAFWYYGCTYGIRFLSPIGLSTEEEPSASKIATLIDYIKKEKICALFVENLAHPKQIQMIAKATNTVIGGTLYADGLSVKGGEADTYLKMIRHNTLTLKNALLSPCFPHKTS